jgi:uncharacterized protein (DUF433 family)
MDKMFETYVKDGDVYLVTPTGDKRVRTGGATPNQDFGTPIVEAGRVPDSFVAAGADGALGVDFKVITTGFNELQKEVIFNAVNYLAYLLSDSDGVDLRDGRVQDIEMRVTAMPIDGRGRYLGFAGPDRLDLHDYLTSIGKINIDSADLPYWSRMRLLHIVFHEAMHVVGFGCFWPMKNLISSDRKWFHGEHAVRMYGSPVPVEDLGGSGTKGAHWSERVFDKELMTGWYDSAGSYLSPISVESLRDLGWQVRKDYLLLHEIQEFM